jgi:methionyl-tRNA synthetase
MEKLSLEGRKYFLTPVCLVPNGRAHLGHIAGPLLKMDVLRRHLRRAGADVRMISLSDAHESHVPIRAHLTGSTPEQVANQFHDAIVKDLATLRIDYDDLINPLDAEWAERYEAITRDLVQRIIHSDNAEIRSEPIPHLVDDGDAETARSSLRPRRGDPIVSGWLKGRCPFCGQPLVGFFCETCGGHFSPQEMQNPGTAHFEGKIEFRNRSSLYLTLKAGPGAISRELQRIMVRSDFAEIAQRYLERRGASIRLTVPSPWGIRVDSPDLPKDEVIWSYSALLYACHLLAGERYRELTGASSNPLAVDSGVTCILSFGIDNTVPFLVGAMGCALGQARYKPFDGLLVNYFYDLEGAKFSTSRDHVIWGGDMVSLAGADADLVRAYLCECNPEFGRASFEIEGFLEFHNAFNRQLRAILEDAFQRAAGVSSLDAGVLRYLKADLRAQAAAFEIGSFDIASAFSAVKRWIARAQALSTTSTAAAAWIAGFALLAAPVMPGLAGWVWAQLGLSGEPTIKTILGQGSSFGPVSQVGPLPLRDSHLTRVEFNACLPAHLRG